MTNRVSVVAWNEILRVFPAIDVNGAVGMRTPKIHDVDLLQLWHVDKLHAIRRDELARAARRFATRVGLELISSAIVVECSRPRLKGDLTDLWNVGELLFSRRIDVVGIHEPHRDAVEGKPYTDFACSCAQVDSSVRPVRRRFRGCISLALSEINIRAELTNHLLVRRLSGKRCHCEQKRNWTHG